jgi:hypothetical protein
MRSELLTVLGKDYVMIGPQKLYQRVKRFEIDRLHGTKIGQRDIDDYLGALPGVLKFDRVTGRAPGVEIEGDGNPRRSKFAVPVQVINEYEVS